MFRLFSQRRRGRRLRRFLRQREGGGRPQLLVYPRRRSGASVEVFHYGSSSGWDGIESGYEDNRGGVTDVAGVGAEGYHPNDVGPYEVVVRLGDVVGAWRVGLRPISLARGHRLVAARVDDTRHNWR